MTTTEREKAKKGGGGHGVEPSGYLLPSSLHRKQFRMPGVRAVTACCVHSARVGDLEMMRGER